MKCAVAALAVLVISILFGCSREEAASDQGQNQQAVVSVPVMDLHTAVVLNNLDVIRQHIEAGSDLNVLEPSRASTPLITAAALGKTDAARILIDAGADLDYQNNDGATALHTAAFFCHVDIVEALLAEGADKTLRNGDGVTARQAVEIPFEQAKGVYDAMGVALRPVGVVLDYDRIKATRPIVAEMLK
jgi:hypothetical protein